MAGYTKNPDVVASLSPEEFYVTQAEWHRASRYWQVAR